ncbi:cytochrome c oxidase subunit 7A2, mitochondrial [Solea solea]|uniref:cytochrome c oxidase subunit 7A2, mitochondrial n=1 Tax=Solea solea TaxID=90069 RepID=UPI00272C3750|nr:cytochrome c oxidase subunit 7A2, mitochondrial [Solea solea]
MFRHVLAFQQVARRSVSTSARQQVKNRVPEKQKLFQEDNGLPIHLKGGTADVLLYRATMTLTVFGVGFTLYQMWEAAFPQKRG